MMHKFKNFTECYLSLAHDVYHNPDYISSPRGQKVKEKLAVKFILENPRSRIPYVKARKFSIQYMVAELLWYLSGEDSTAWISNYSSFWNKISDDGKTANSAYGSRIFRPHGRIANFSLIQWEYIVDELKNDPDTRRAVIHIRSPWDSVQAKLDVPCTLTLQFFIRDEKLHMVVNMRSSDLILGIAYDVPAFTMFQEMLALELGVGLGTYTHVSNSLHIYERHFGMVEEMLKDSAIQQSQMMQISRGEIPFMGPVLPIKEMMVFEKYLRTSDSSSQIDTLLGEIDFLDVEDISYWKDWGKILASHRLKKLGLKDEAIKMQNSTEFVGYHTLK
jgi:thymidylate synthase